MSIADQPVDSRKSVYEGLDAGDIDRTRRSFELFCADVESSHRDKMHLIGICLGFIRERLGEAALEEVWRKDFEDLGLTSFFAKMTPDELAAAVITACRFVAAPLPIPEGEVPFDVEEDAEKYVVNYRRCGSGGLFRREPNSTSGQPWPVLEGKHHWAFGEHVNLYCPHCKVITDMAREQGVGYEVRFGSRSPTDPCQYIVRKMAK